MYIYHEHPVAAFQLPWEDIFSKFKLLQNEGSQKVQLPRTGKALHELVQVLFMKQGEKLEPEVIKQATVRRNVVVKLIQAMVDRQHREYKHYKMDTK